MATKTKDKKSNIYFQLLRFHYRNLSSFENIIIRIKIKINSKYQKLYKELQEKLDFPSHSLPGDAFREGIKKRLENRNRSVSEALPESKIRNLFHGKLIWASAFVILIAIPFYLLKIQNTFSPELQLYTLKPDSERKIIELPVVNLALSSGEYARKITKNPYLKMVLMPKTRLNIEKLDIRVRQKRMEGRLKLSSGGVYIELKKGKADVKLEKISWQVKTPAGTITALGTTFYIAHNQQNGSIIYLKEGKLEIKSPEQKMILKSPGAAKADVQYLYKAKEKNAPQKIISFFSELENNINPSTRDNETNPFSEKKLKNLFNDYAFNFQKFEKEKAKTITIFQNKKSPLRKYKIFLKSGMVLIGKIKHREQEKIILDTDEGEFNINVRDIQKQILLK